MPTKKKKESERKFAQYKSMHEWAVIFAKFEAQDKLNAREYSEKIGVVYGTFNHNYRKYRELKQVETDSFRVKERVTTVRSLSGDVGFIAPSAFRNTGELIDEKREQFAQKFVTGNPPFNPIFSYMQTFAVEDPQEVGGIMRLAAMANDLLREPEVAIRITKLLTICYTLTDEVIDAQLAYLVMQNSDLKVKLNAIETYLKLHDKFDGRDAGKKFRTVDELMERLMNNKRLPGNEEQQE